MPRASLHEMYRQFGWKLLIMVILVVVIFAGMYFWERQRTSTTPQNVEVSIPSPQRN